MNRPYIPRVLWIAGGCVFFLGAALICIALMLARAYTHAEPPHETRSWMPNAPIVPFDDCEMTPLPVGGSYRDAEIYAGRTRWLVTCAGVSQMLLNPAKETK